MPILAQIPYDARAALGVTRGADITPVQYEPVMGIFLEFGFDNAIESILHLTHRFPGRKARPVGYAEYVCVDGNRWLTEGRVQDHVCGLSTDTRERLEGTSVGGHLPAVLVQ